MKISIVIPAFNEEKYIKTCLEHVCSQTVKPYEILVIDNNSTDKTKKIAHLFPVKIVRESVQGMIPARNCGFDSAKGDIIARCDADTKAPPDWLSKIAQSFTKYKTDGITGPGYFYELTSKQKNDPMYVFTMKLTRALLNGKMQFNGPNMAITKKMWKRVRTLVCLDDTKVHEDIDLAIHVHQAGGTIRFEENVTVGMSARRMLKKPESYFIEYPIRVIKTLGSHDELFLQQWYLKTKSKTKSTLYKTLNDSLFSNYLK